MQHADDQVLHVTARLRRSATRVIGHQRDDRVRERSRKLPRGIRHGVRRALRGATSRKRESDLDRSRRMNSPVASVGRRTAPSPSPGGLDALAPPRRRELAISAPVAALKSSPLIDPCIRDSPRLQRRADQVPRSRIWQPACDRPSVPTRGVQSHARSPSASWTAMQSMLAPHGPTHQS